MIHSGIRILVVHDERNTRYNLTMVLKAAGFEVDATGVSEEAIAKCKQQRYDIAFVDIKMPKIGGLELVRYIQEFS